MLIFPAVDILGGQAVRLFQGDYNQKQAFGDDPAAFARLFQQQGATHLHLVDLDGAKAGTPQNFGVIQGICANTSLYVELGGGIRTRETVEKCFEAGVNRVILGTAALQDRAFTQKMIELYADKIAIGVDARDGKVAVEGWLTTSETDSYDFCKEMVSIGAKYVIYTDISRDGAERGANLEVYGRLAELKGLSVTASGGVSSMEDILALKEMGLYAAILGKALYTGKVDLAEAVAAAL